MSEESVPKKKAARKVTRKRSTSKKAAKKSTADAVEEQLPFTNEAPVVLPGESLSSQPIINPAADSSEESAPPEQNSANTTKSAPEKEEGEKINSTQSEASTSIDPVPAAASGAGAAAASLIQESDSTSEPAEKSEKSKPKSRVRDARRETANEPLETSEPLIKEINDGDESPPKNKDSKDSKESRDSRDHKEQGERDDSKGERQEKGNRRNRNRNRGRREDGPIQRIEIDFDQMRKKAWKIYQSEVTEEGLALLDDKALREYARSSFNAARLFLEEEAKNK